MATAKAKRLSAAAKKRRMTFFTTSRHTPQMIILLVLLLSAILKQVVQILSAARTLVGTYAFGIATFKVLYRMQPSLLHAFVKPRRDPTLLV